MWLPNGAASCLRSFVVSPGLRERSRATFVSSPLGLVLRLRLPPRQVLPEVGLEGGQAFLGPRAFDGLGDALVFLHDQPEGLVLGVFRGREPVAVVGVGAEE